MLDREVLEADGLRAFAAFAEHLNFTTAAAQLHISQPALHVKIRKLGASLGSNCTSATGGTASTREVRPPALATGRTTLADDG